MEVSQRLDRRFLWFWAGQTASALGSSTSGMGLAIYLYFETGSAAWLGAMSAVATAPFLLVSPLHAALDRLPRKGTMIGADTLASLGTIVAFAFALAGELEPWHLLVVAVVGGLGTAFQMPAATAAIPLLVPAGQLARANGLMQVPGALSIVVAPMVAAPLVAWVGIEAVLIVDLVTFAIAVAVTVATDFREQPIDHTDPERRGWAPVWRWLRGPGRPVAVLMMTGAVVNFFLAWFNIGVLALGANLGGESLTGLPIALVGVSMLVGTAVVGQRGLPDDHGGVFAVGLIVFGVGCAVAAMRPHFSLLIVGVVLATAMLPALSAGASTIFHEWVPEHLQGRVFGVRQTASRSLDPLGSVIGGLLVVEVLDPLADQGGTRALVGEGGARGAALLFLAIAAAEVVIGLAFLRSRTRLALRGGGPSAIVRSEEGLQQHGDRAPVGSAVGDEGGELTATGS